MEGGAQAGDGSGSSSGSPWLDGATFEERLQEDLDLGTGSFRLKCISRQQLPTDSAEDAGLQRMLEGESFATVGAVQGSKIAGIALLSTQIWHWTVHLCGTLDTNSVL